jgi:VCBS repeat-containing protein
LQAFVIICAIYLWCKHRDELDFEVIPEKMPQEESVLDERTVYETVEGENDGPTAVADAFSVGENGTVIGDILGNDTDVDGDDLMITSANGAPINTPFTVTSAGGREGTAIVAADGVPNIIFNTDSNFDDMSAGDTDTVEITYEISDGNGGTSSETVTITVNGENDDPVAVGEYFSVSEDGSIIYDLLLNDTDVEGDSLTLMDVEGNGTGVPFTVMSAYGREAMVIFEEDSSPNIVFAPTDSFDDLGEGTYDIVELDYTVSDGNGGTDVATAVIYITGEEQIEANGGTYFTGPLPTGIDIIEF